MKQVLNGRIFLMIKNGKNMIKKVLNVRKYTVIYLKLLRWSPFPDQNTPFYIVRAPCNLVRRIRLWSAGGFT